MLGSECPFNWQDSMTKPSHFSALLMHFFHDLGHDSQWVYLSEDRIDFDEADALSNDGVTLTLVSTCVSNLAFAFLL
jgi:hypothetical protein